MRFPSLRTRDLEGRDRILPEDLPSGRRVILMAFQRWHQLTVDEWNRVLDGVRQSHSDLSVWEVPTLSRAYTPGRRFIDGGMRAGIPDVQVREHTLTAYADLRKLARKLDIPDFEAIQVFLLDAEGEILWRTEGRVSDESIDELQRVLASTDTAGALSDSSGS
ncbi:MAG: hypothetical protein OEV43_07085 [Coriobacteriia bacterium]|nr:hypothetical protein [Coriobacteriia bacterium]